MIYSIYYVEDNIPFDVIESVVDTRTEETNGYGNATLVGKSSVKAEILSRKRIVEFINKNNDYNGGPVFSDHYIQTIINEIDDLEEEHPEEAI